MHAGSTTHCWSLLATTSRRSELGRFLQIGFLAGYVASLSGCHQDVATEPVAAEDRTQAAGVFCQDSSYDAGQVLEGGSVQHTFLLVNRTDSLRTISRLEKNCSCLHAAASTLQLEPGATSEVTVVLTAGRAERLVGTSVSVHFEGFEKTLKLSLGARVAPHLRVWPRSLNFGKLSQDQTVSRSLRVQQDSDGAPELQSVVSDTRAVRTTIRRVTNQPPHAWEVTALLSSSDVDSELKSQLRLLRSDGREIIIPLWASPSWGFEIEPPRPMLVVMGAKAEQEIAVRSREGWPFVITEVRLDVPFLQAHIPDQEIPQDTHRLTLRGEYGNNKNEIRGSGEVLVRVTQFQGRSATQSELSIPVSYWMFANANRTEDDLPMVIPASD